MTSINSTFKVATFLVAFLAMVSGQTARPKILCLHGGGGTGNGFSSVIQDLVDSMPDYEFVFATAPYRAGDGGRLWIRDPPGGKGDPTQDPAFADASIQELDDIRASEGPFYGLLGFSQGAAFVPVYLSRVPVGTFQVAITFCGYLTETHQGILRVVNENSPFGDIPHLVWMGQQDYLISNGMTNAMAAIFTNPYVVVSRRGGHYPPGTSDSTFDQVTSWIRQQDDAPTSEPMPSTSPTRAPPTVACVDGDGKFFFKMKGKRALYKPCTWLAKKSAKAARKICRKYVDHKNDYVPAQDLCEETCASCGACYENPNTKWVFNIKKTKVVLKTCGWLAGKNKKQKDKYCKKKKFSSGGYTTPSLSCPSTCDTC